MRQVVARGHEARTENFDSPTALGIDFIRSPASQRRMRPMLVAPGGNGPDNWTRSTR